MFKIQHYFKKGLVSINHKIRHEQHAFELFFSFKSSPEYYKIIVAITRVNTLFQGLLHSLSKIFLGHF